MASLLDQLKSQARIMTRNQLEFSFQTQQDVKTEVISSSLVSLEAEIPEALYLSMKKFVDANSNWDQSSVISSAISNFLFQNGCNDRPVMERYLNDLFTRSEI